MQMSPFVSSEVNVQFFFTQWLQTYGRQMYGYKIKVYKYLLAHTGKASSTGEQLRFQIK